MEWSKACFPTVHKIFSHWRHIDCWFHTASIRFLHLEFKKKAFVWNCFKVPYEKFRSLAGQCSSHSSSQWRLMTSVLSTVKSGLVKCRTFLVVTLCRTLKASRDFNDCFTLDFFFHLLTNTGDAADKFLLTTCWLSADYMSLRGARGSIVCWGIMLQTGKLRIRLYVSLILFQFT
jgi:hypothetical protein